MTIKEFKRTVLQIANKKTRKKGIYDEELFEPYLEELLEDKKPKANILEGVILIFLNSKKSKKEFPNSKNEPEKLIALMLLKKIPRLIRGKIYQRLVELLKKKQFKKEYYGKLLSLIEDNLNNPAYRFIEKETRSFLNKKNEDHQFEWICDRFVEILYKTDANKNATIFFDLIEWETSFSNERVEKGTSYIIMLLILVDRQPIEIFNPVMNLIKKESFKIQVYFIESFVSSIEQSSFRISEDQCKENLKYILKYLGWL